MKFARWWRSIDISDALILFYLLAFIRQYYWLINNNRFAWLFTAVTAAAVWIVFLRFKPPSEKTNYEIWLIVALPLLLFYSLRVAFPDISFDVLNYRLVQSERALYGPPFIHGDFFPVIFPLNPSPDLITGIFRHVLGYRLGTVVNYLTIIWLAVILNRLLRQIISVGWTRGFAVLVILLCEHILFEINTYMVDLLALPLLLESVWLTFKYRDSEHKQRDLIFIAALLGGSMAIKLSNVTAVAPITLWLIFEFFSIRENRNRGSVVPILIAAVVFFLPILPHALYIYRDTGSPFFPLYNEIFKSTYWPEINVGDGRWGPRNPLEAIAWPVSSSLLPQRLSELGLYSGRLALSTIAALVCLLRPRSHRSVRWISFVVILGSLLWSFSSGYIRYALFFELLGGFLIVYIMVILYSRLTAMRLGWVLLSLPLVILLAQCSVALTYAYRTEWAGRRTFFERPKDFLAETRYFFHDHNLSKFLTPDKKSLIWNVDGWIVSSVKSSGPEVLLRNDVPMIGIHNLEYFDMPKSRERFARTLNMISGKRFFSLALTDESETAVTNMRRRGFNVSEPVPVRVPFYSDSVVLPMVLFEVTPANTSLPPKPNTPVVTESAEPLPDNAFAGELSIAETPRKLLPGEKTTINVHVKNVSQGIWPARGGSDGRFFIRVANAWFDNQNRLVNNMDGRSNLPYDLWPGDSVDIPLTITAPAQAGDYFLEIDIVQEGVTFFKAKGSNVVRVRVEVR